MPGPGFMTFILMTNVATELLVTAVALPLIQRRVAPNGLYGFRVRRTLDPPGVWYDANQYAGRRFLWFGSITSLGALSLFFVSGIHPIVYAVACLMFTWVGLTASVALSFRHRNR